MSELHWLDPADRSGAFPSVEHALVEPNGLLAIGGDLSPPRLLDAYRRGIFPWYSEGQPILWWSPDPRLVLVPDRIHVGRSLRKVLRRKRFTISVDTAFAEVVSGCAASRPGQLGTWITDEMSLAYRRLHALGYAHSVEVRLEDRLVGGLYGVSIGRAFFGESMFSRVSDASKVCLVYLCRQLAHWGFPIIDCQVRTEHLVSMGAMEIPRRNFVEAIASACKLPFSPVRWRADREISAALGEMPAGGGV